MLAYACNGDQVNASHVLQVRSNDTRDADSQAWAADWRARLEKGVAPALLFAEMRRLGQAGPAVKKWTLDADTVVQDVERIRGFERIRAVIPFGPPNGTPEDDVQTYMGTR